MDLAEATCVLASISQRTLRAYSLDPLSARGSRIEGMAEVLGLTGSLPVSELHILSMFLGEAALCKDGIVKGVGGAEYAPHHKALLVRLPKPDA